MKQDATQQAGEGDSPKRHGDKFGVGTSPPVPKGEVAASGDSPKHQGDKLAQAVEEAAKE